MIVPDTNAALIAEVKARLARIERFDYEWNAQAGSHNLIARQEGEWVRYEDAADEVRSLADRLEAAERELAGINRALGTRAIFDGCATGEDKVDAMDREISRLERENEARHE
jgi:hypothetical protein